MSGPLRHGPITRRVIEAIRRQMRMKVVDLAAFRAGQEYAEELQNTVTPKERLAKTHPAFAAYVYAQNQMSVMAEQLLRLPEMKSFAKQIDTSGFEDGNLPGPGVRRNTGAGPGSHSRPHL